MFVVSKFIQTPTPTVKKNETGLDTLLLVLMRLWCFVEQRASITQTANQPQGQYRKLQTLNDCRNGLMNLSITFLYLADKMTLSKMMVLTLTSLHP